MGIKSSVTDVLEHAIRWQSEGHGVELITVVKTFGSSPRPVGSLAAVRHDGHMVGSVSGGCIEKQLVEQIRSGHNPAPITYNVTDAEAKRFGLMCGGSIELLFENVSENSKLSELQQRLNRNQRTTRHLHVATGEVTLNDAAEQDQFHFDGESLINILGANYHLIIIGANELSRFTVEFAQAVDFEVSVIEPREEFNASWPIPTPTPINQMPDDAVIELARHEHCGVLALTHDPNLDDLALLEALTKNLFYVGALGSTRSHEKRLARLRHFDAPENKLDTIHAPIGVNIGSRTASEIAISIVAELVKLRAEHRLVVN